MVARGLIVVSVALLVAGCGGKDDTAATTTTTATTAATTTTTTATTTATTTEPLLPGASTEPAVWKSTSEGIKLLTNVRAASHDGFDRLVFQFRNGVPGYDVRYVQPPVRADGSGETVDVDGVAILVIRMEPALDADLTKPSAPRTYTGPTRLTPDTKSIVEVVRTGGFEAVLTWAVGTAQKVPFVVTRLDSPPRLVIDVSTS
jgi:hypothetical protein